MRGWGATESSIQVVGVLALVIQLSRFDLVAGTAGGFPSTTTPRKIAPFGTSVGAWRACSRAPARQALQVKPPTKKSPHLAPDLCTICMVTSPNTLGALRESPVVCVGDQYPWKVKFGMVSP